MFHKPQGCITATVDPRHTTVFDYLPQDMREGLFPVGRLDKDTEGLLLITDDGPLNSYLLHPVYHVDKTYEFFAIGTMDEDKKRRLEEGISIDDGRSLALPSVFSMIETMQLGDILPLLSDKDRKRAAKHLQTPVLHATLTVREGKKHQVKRMLRAVNCHIVYLKRLTMGGLSLDEDLPKGAFRPLCSEEIEILYQSTPLGLPGEKV